jgi:Ca-activated chloride channel family protein
MELAHPYFLLLLPFLLAWPWWRSLRQDRDAVAPLWGSGWMLRHPHLDAGSLDARQKRSSGLWFHMLAYALIALALAQPRQIGAWIIPPPDGRDIALVVDTSLTMSIDDFTLHGRKIERLAMLKDVMGQFIQDRPDDRFAILAFGSKAALLTPPTFDHALAIAELNRLQVGMAGPNTALGDALGLALKHLQSRKLKPVIILVSDGGDSNTGDMTPAEAVAVARSMHVAVHTVQIGTDLFAAGRPVAADSSQARDVQPGLAEISRLTGGHFWFARDTQTTQQIVHDVGEMEKTLARPALHRQVREWYWLPLLLAAICLVFAHVLEIRGRR